MRRAPALLLAVALVLLAGPLRAQQAHSPAPEPQNAVPTRLTYTVAPSSRGCPSAETFRAIAREHLHLKGADPFADPPADSQQVRVEVSPEGRGYKVLLTLVDGAGAQLDAFTPWRRDTCVGAVEDAGGAVRQWLVRGGGAAPAAPAPTPAPKPPEPEPTPLPASTPPKPPIVFRLGASFWGDYATVPGIVPGIAASVGVRSGEFSGAIEGRWDTPGSLGHAAGDDVVSQFSGALVLCGHLLHGWLVPCVLGKISNVQVFGTASMLPAVTVVRGGGGIRLAADVPMPLRWLFIEPAIDILGASPVAGSPATNLLKLPRFNGGLGVALLVELDWPYSWLR